MSLVGDGAREVAGCVAGNNIRPRQVSVFHSAALRLRAEIHVCEVAEVVVGVADVLDRIYRIVRIECVASCAAKFVPMAFDGVCPGDAGDGLVRERTVCVIGEGGCAGGVMRFCLAAHGVVIKRDRWSVV